MLANELLFERSHSHKIRVCAAAGDFLENGGAAFVSASALPRLCASAGHAQQLFMAVSEAADYTCPVRALFRFLNNPRHAQTGVPLLAPVTDTLIWSAGLPWVREKELLSLFGAQRTQHPDAMLKSLQCNAKAPQLSRAFYDLDKERIDPAAKKVIEGKRIAVLSTCAAAVYVTSLLRRIDIDSPFAALLPAAVSRLISQNQKAKAKARAKENERRKTVMKKTALILLGVLKWMWLLSRRTLTSCWPRLFLILRTRKRLNE